MMFHHSEASLHLKFIPLTESKHHGTWDFFSDEGSGNLGHYNTQITRSGP